MSLGLRLLIVLSSSLTLRKSKLEGLPLQFFQASQIVRNQRPFSNFFNFFVTCDWAQSAIVFVTGEPFRLSVMKHSSLLCPFVKRSVVSLADRGLVPFHLRKLWGVFISGMFPPYSKTSG
jgi:hypothetical protein